MVRIMGGKARGRKLAGPRGLQFRPTTGRVKEFIYSYFQHIITDAVILDLFSGTGSLGIEALSRGAGHVTFVERSPVSLNLLKKNIHTVGFEADSRIIRGDVFSTLRRLGRDQVRFDLILADPPFKMNFHQRILQTVSEYQLLHDDGILLIEHDAHDPADDFRPMEQIKERAFGDCVVSIYQTGQES